METIRIRRAGYPIRHTFAEFVDRYRILVPGIKPSLLEECRSASDKICRAVLGDADYQLGRTKVFVKVCGCDLNLFNCYVRFTSFARVPGLPRKSWNLRNGFSRPGESWKMTVVMEKSWNSTNRSWNFLTEG